MPSGLGDRVTQAHSREVDSEPTFVSTQSGRRPVAILGHDSSVIQASASFLSRLSEKKESFTK